MNKNELIAAISEFGIDGVADRLGVDEDLLGHAALGEPSRQEQAIIDRGFAEYEITELERGDESELNRIDELAQEINKIELFSGNNWEDIKEFILSGDIAPEGFTTFEHLSANLTEAQFEQVLDYAKDHGVDFLYEFEIGDGFDFHGADSAFWEWFRDEFYSD